MMDDLEKVLRHEIAAKVVAALPEEQKREIIARGIVKVLEDMNFRLSYEIEKLLVEQALVFAGEYIKRPEVQETIRQKAHRAVDAILDQIVELIAKRAEEAIKSKYVSLFEK